MTSSFSILKPVKPLVPIVVSIPHAGTQLPAEIAASLKPEIVATLPDTDWFLPELYNFCTDLGIPMIYSQLSRYVIDLNRPIDGPALYTDHRRQTDLMPLTSFAGVDLYLMGQTPDAAERNRRVKCYYEPYHTALQGLLTASQRLFGQVLLFDAHSIRRSLPSIASEPFADFIVGDCDGQTAAPSLSQSLVTSLQTANFQVKHNQPFKGGQITRLYGKPSLHQHALQLEMSQDIYLTRDRQGLDERRVAIFRSLLQQAFLALIQHLRVIL